MTNITTFSGRQLNRAFQRLKDSDQKRMREKGYVSPEVGKDKSHPVFSEKEAAVMLYIYDFGNGFNRRQVKELHKLVEEEIAKSEKKPQ